MPKFYVTDGNNQFIVDTQTHLQACCNALRCWEKKQKAIGKFILYGQHGFESISDNNRIESRIIRGLNFKDG